MNPEKQESIDATTEQFSDLIDPEKNQERNLKSEALLEQIAQHRKNMKYLINVATGEKKIKINSKKFLDVQLRTMESDLRLVWTLKNLRQQILALEKQLAQL